MWCPKEHTDLAKFIVDLNKWGRLSFEPRGGDGREISEIRPERRLLSIQVYTWAVAQQGEQGWGVATMAATQPPQMQCVSRLQMLQRASAPGAASCSGIARHLMAMDGYYSHLSTGIEGKDEVQEDNIEESGVKDEEQELGLADSSAE